MFIGFIGLIFFAYQTYGPALLVYFYGEQKVSLVINEVPVIVTLADTPEERARGLSNTPDLPDNEGMLFIFEEAGNYRFWMKDTLIPLDIIWIDNDQKIVHIERNVQPDTYPTAFGPTEPARFVLEVNAFFVNTFNLGVGDKVMIPAHVLPKDLSQ